MVSMFKVRACKKEALEGDLMVYWGTSGYDGAGRTPVHLQEIFIITHLYIQGRLYKTMIYAFPIQIFFYNASLHMIAVQL